MDSNKLHQHPLQGSTRRHFFRECGVGVGKIALASLLCSPTYGATRKNPLAPQPAHFGPKAKHVIYLFMAEMSELLPHLSTVADDIAIVRSVHTDQFNHAPAQLFMNTGSPLQGRPCIGSWATYGLGSLADDLPGFVVLNSGAGISAGASNWSCGFLPTEYQGVPFRSQGSPILNVNSPDGIDAAMQRHNIDLINQLNQHRLDALADPEIGARINAYEMAYKMQSSAPDLIDFSQESQETLDLYGADPSKPSFANNCLLARRMVERGVRFVNCYHGSWDHHSDVAGGLKSKCQETDQACAALITDLKRRGLLEDTLVVWGGEFGRTPMVESIAALGRSMGRDHHPQAFTMWLAGGGIKAGQTIGATDDLGFNITSGPFMSTTCRPPYSTSWA